MIGIDVGFIREIEPADLLVLNAFVQRREECLQITVFYDRDRQDVLLAVISYDTVPRQCFVCRYVLRCFLLQLMLLTLLILVLLRLWQQSSYLLFLLPF